MSQQDNPLDKFLRQPAGTASVRNPLLEDGHLQDAGKAKPGQHEDVMDFISAGRDKNAFKRAKTHSGMVRVLKIALPVVGILMISAIAASYYLSRSGLPDVAIESASITNGKMVMKNPQLKGFDKQKRPYELNAFEAIQDPAKPDQVELSRIDANVPMEDGIYAKIKAGKGFYDSAAKTLLLEGNVDVETDNGMTISLVDADIDMDAGTLATNQPVSMTSPQAKVSADKLSISGNGERIIFENRVRMTIYPDKFESAENSSAAN